MDWNRIRANLGDRKGRFGDIADALSKSLGVNYATIKQDCEGTYELLVDSLVEDRRFDRARAEAIMSIALDTMQTVVNREYGGKKRTGKLPMLAAEVAGAALEVLAEALPNGRTLQAYRNRHDDFIQAMAKFAEQVSGEDTKHHDFYHELGKQVAHAVMEHELVPLGLPNLQPLNSVYYSDIATAALEQLVYFIGAGEGGPIKIGIAVNPQVRLAALQTAHHEQLIILAITSGGRERELAYHAEFGARRLKGEWFTRCPEIEAEIERLNEGAAP